MIGFLTGRLHAKQPPFLWLDVQGVGYEIEAPMSTIYALPELNEQVTLLIHTHVREDAILLFGFATDDEKNLYKTLIKVNGVGAKMALGVLSAMSVSDFVHLVASADSLGMTRIPGVGKKTAERLLIEMRDRLSDWQGVEQAELVESTASSSKKVNHQPAAIEALMSLGYRQQQAEEMVKSVGTEENTVTLEETIRRALQSVKL